MDQQYAEIKAHSKQVLDRSRNVLDEAPDEVRKEYQEMEAVRLDWDAKVKEAKAKGLPPPDPAGTKVDTRTANELKAELETQQAKLDLNLHTNPGVVEQYEKRKRDVCVVSIRMGFSRGVLWHLLILVVFFFRL